MMRRIIAMLAIILASGCHTAPPVSRPVLRATRLTERPSPTKPVRRHAEQHRTYTVKQGDSVSKIAYMMYGDATRWRSIIHANGMRSVIVEPGQVLLIPELTDLTATDVTTRAMARHLPHQSCTVGSLSVSAVSVTVSPGGSVTASGDAVVHGGDRTIRAQHVVVSHSTDGRLRVIATGDMEMKREDGKGLLDSMRGDRLEYYFDQK